VTPNGRHHPPPGSHGDHLNERGAGAQPPGSSRDENQRRRPRGGRRRKVEALGSASPLATRRNTPPLPPSPRSWSTPSTGKTPCAPLDTSADRHSWPSSESRSHPSASKATTAKAASRSRICLCAFCSRRRARKPRAAACSCTTTDTRTCWTPVPL
jgi:hypothetical protein